MSDYIFQIPVGRGNIEVTKNKMIQDDFYSFFSNDEKEKNKLNKLSFSNGITFSFENEINRKNFQKYLQSDFSRFCLCLLKNNKNIHRGEMTIIPKQPIPISDELKEYIEEFLPDYYNIR